MTVDRPRWRLVMALLVVTAVVAGCTGVVWEWSLQFNPKLPAIVSDLPGGWDPATAEFTRRLQERNPPGTPEEALIRSLARDGFRPAWSTQAGEREADLTWSTGVCNMLAAVYWRTDSGGRVQSIRGYYHEAGCL